MAAISSDNVFFGMFRVKVIEHGMQGSALIRLLSRLNDNIQKSLRKQGA
jgi:hypothetical protein